MANFNQVILLGNLTRDVELRHTQSGQALAKFGLAVNRKYTVNGEQKEETCFVDLTAWGRQAEVLNQYVKKGSQLFVQGRLQFSTWEGQDGAKKSKLEVVVENFQFVGSRGGGGSMGGGVGGEEGGEQRPRSAARKPAAQQEGGAAGGAAGGAGGGEGVDYGDIPF